MADELAEGRIRCAVDDQAVWWDPHNHVGTSCTRLPCLPIVSAFCLEVALVWQMRERVVVAGAFNVDVSAVATAAARRALAHEANRTLAACA